MKKEIVIVAALRTAIGNFNGSLSSFAAPELGAIVLRELLKQTKVAPNAISEVILGQVLTANVGQGPARQSAMKADIPFEVPATTINMMCGSGLKSVHLAVQAILCDDAEIIIAGGQESMSQSPYILPNARKGLRMGDASLVDSMIKDGLMDVFNNCHMGITAENIAEKYKISRVEQDQFALQSQQKAASAQRNGYFVDEIVPISIPQHKAVPIIFNQDEFIRHDASLEKLQHLRAVFKTNGSITSGNSSGINDGAAAVMLMSANKAKQLGLPVLASIKAFAACGVDPAFMGLGPIPASRLVLQKSGWSIDDLDLIEANEAFAAQSIAVCRELAFDSAKVNVNGGAIALGHPIGVSGCRTLVTLVHELQRRKLSKGLVTLCVGGGMGVALTLERPTA